MIKVLNLYAGIGGNRKLWKDVEVTAVENNPEIAKIYQDFFPDDKVIVTDAHKYLLEHYKEFDFIWSSPPCPSHSWFRKKIASNVKPNNPRYGKPLFPDMELYEEIIFLKHYFKGKWVVENVVPYYEPLIKPQKCGRHLFWSNFNIINIKFKSINIERGSTKQWQEILGFNLDNYKIKHRKDQILTNCVIPKLGLHILECAFKIKQETLGEKFA